MRSIAPDKSKLVTVDGSGRVSVWKLLDPSAVAFWSKMASHPTALTSACHCVSAFELVLYGESPSGRTIATHCAASGNRQVLSTLTEVTPNPEPGYGYGIGWYGTG